MGAVEVVTIGGVAYVVEMAKSPADLEAEGLKNVANLMREDGVARQLVLRRPKGARRFVSRECVVSLPNTGRVLGRTYTAPVALF